VIADCCTDFDKDVHNCLTQKIFPAAPHTRVVKSSDFLDELKFC
jgi:hypothetical protein